jgi:acyl-CoA thioester hydrolase
LSNKEALAGDVFAWTQRVYYQHTDAGGMVFHANYLAFMENARTEMLAAAGIDLGKLLREESVCFVVHSANITFKKPALLNDLLTVTARVAQAGRARLVFDQEVRRAHEVLARADITIACVHAQDHRLIPLPAAIRSRFTPTRLISTRFTSTRFTSTDSTQ